MRSRSMTSTTSLKRGSENNQEKQIDQFEKIFVSSIIECSYGITVSFSQFSPVGLLITLVRPSLVHCNFFFGPR